MDCEPLLFMFFEIWHHMVDPEEHLEAVIRDMEKANWPGVSVIFNFYIATLKNVG
jgi:hypothetical protein